MENLKNWFLKTQTTLLLWIKQHGLINIGWVVGGILLFLFGSKLIGGIFTGIFIEKNRYQLLKIWKDLVIKK